MKQQRKHYTPEEKVAILRSHLLEQVPISELCDKQGLQPTAFYRWQKELFESGAAAPLEAARRLVEGYVEHYNNVRLNSAIGCITPKDMLAGHQQEIHADRDRKLERRDNNSRFVASRPREKAKMLVSGRFHVTDEVDYF